MASSPPTFRVGIYGSEESPTFHSRGCGLWSPGYSAAVTAAGVVMSFVKVTGWLMAG